MKFNVAQALAILATTNPAVALQSTDYADNLAVVARDVVPEAATAWAPVEEAPVIEAREPRRGPANGGGYKYTGDYQRNLASNLALYDALPKGAVRGASQKHGLQAREPRRGRPGRGGSDRLGKAVKAAEFVAAGSEAAKNVHQMVQNSKQPAQKRDLEAREPRRGRPGRGGSDRLGKAVKAAEFVAAGSEAAKNVHQMVQNSKQQKRDLEAREPRRGGYKQKLRASTAVGAAFGQMLGNVQQMGLNQLADKQQPQQEQTAAAKRDLEVREPRRGRPGRGGGDLLGKAVKAAELVGAGSQAANNVHQIVQNSKQQKRDLEAREPRRGRPGRGGGDLLGKAVKAAELVGAGSQAANNVHQIVQNSKQQKRDLEAREPRRGRPGRGGGDLLGKAVKAAELVGAGSQAANNVHQIVQNSKQQKRDLEAREPRRGRPGRGGGDLLGKAVKAAELVGAGSQAANNVHQIVQNSKQQKRDLEAREPRRGRSGRGGSDRLGKAAKAAELVAAGSETANNVHQIVQNSKQQKRDLEARELRRGRSGRGGSDRLGKAVKAAQFVAAGTEAAKNAHQIVQNSQQQKRDQLEAREPRRRVRISSIKPAKLVVAGDERLGNTVHAAVN